MKYLLRYLLVFALLSASVGFASDLRVSRLIDSGQIENFEMEGHWRAEVFPSGVAYICLKCGVPVHAEVVLRAPYRAESYGAAQDRYLAERTAFCAELVVQGAGQCVGSDATSMRGGALTGYVSEARLGDGARDIEIVFFYREAGYAPALIRASLSVPEGARLPDGTLAALRWQMARLTLFW